MPTTTTTTMTIAVTGATGAQGGATARHLLRRGYAVRAIVRDPAGASASALRSQGADVVVGDFDRPEGLGEALRGVDAAFVMATPFIEGGPATEVRHGMSTIDAAVSAGVGHIVYSSVASADRRTGVPHFESKSIIERHLRHVRPDATVVAPTEFVDLVLAPWAIDSLRDGWFGVPVDGDIERQLTVVDDIGALAATVLADPRTFAGRRIEIASFTTTGHALAATIARHAGPMRYEAPPIEVIADDDLRAMYAFMAAGGYDVDIEALHDAHPEVAWHTAEAWAAGIDWPALVGRRADADEVADAVAVAVA